ncbi:MAG TPA: biopolymer transporter ExbD [Pirellulales bacterium]|jgi:biopolymer transport protein ExbD|nr:biopolymer transporter ExbD [Pirellulales bacterium]
MAGKIASSYDDDEAGVMSDINVTPLVDVTLVLLIVFMITVPAVVGSAQLKVDLPESIAADPNVAALPMRLAVRREPTGEVGLYLNDQKTDEPSLKRLVADLKQGGSEPPVLLAGDKNVAYGEVVKVIDLLTSLGLRKVSLETRRVAGH